MESDPGVFTELIKGFGEGDVGAGAAVTPLGCRDGSEAAAPLAAAVGLRLLPWGCQADPPIASSGALPGA